MKITRIYTGSDGESHFEDMDMPLEEAEAALQDKRSGRIKASGVIFRETGGDYDLDFHNAPERQYVIMLEGGVEITVGDGTTRKLGTGSILLAEDTTAVLTDVLGIVVSGPRGGTKDSLP